MILSCPLWWETHLFCPLYPHELEVCAWLWNRDLGLQFSILFPGWLYPLCFNRWLSFCTNYFLGSCKNQAVFEETVLHRCGSLLLPTPGLSKPHSTCFRRSSTSWPMRTTVTSASLSVEPCGLDLNLVRKVFRLLLSCLSLLGVRYVDLYKNFVLQIKKYPFKPLKWIRSNNAGYWTS